MIEPGFSIPPGRCRVGCGDGNPPCVKPPCMWCRVFFEIMTKHRGVVMVGFVIPISFARDLYDGMRDWIFRKFLMTPKAAPDSPPPLPSSPLAFCKVCPTQRLGECLHTSPNRCWSSLPPCGQMERLPGSRCGSSLRTLLQNCSARSIQLHSPTPHPDLCPPHPPPRPQEHDRRVQDVQAQVLAWNASDLRGKKLMCTARAPWLSMSVRSVPRDRSW